ncbi:MAG: sortase [Candidatus Levybacteria bacterium]|nr:sortase [Candidatus Levybacteria bacterium]
MSKTEIIRFLILRTIGNFLVLFAVFGVVATFGPSLYYEVSFRIVQARGVKYVVADETSPLGEILKKQNVQTEGLSGGFASVLAGSKEQILMPKDTDFSILIPKLGISSKVFANINPASENEFLPILQQGVAHAKGTVFPGIPGNIYLFAHSTDNFWNVGRYNAVFYLLKDLVPGDDVIIFFENQRHNYIVTETKILDGDDTSFLTNSQTGKEVLILQTCWPPGTTWKRLLVFAKPK